jgi:hypothetical protein
MHHHPRASRPLVLLALALGCAACSSDNHASGASQGAHLSLSFDGKAVLPAGWRADTTNLHGTPGRWIVAMDSGAPTPPNAVALIDTGTSTDETFNLFWTDAVRAADVDLSVALHADGGDEDQGGGLAWRMRGSGDYYVTRWNPLEGNLRLYRVQNGQRTQLKGVKTTADPARWHTLRVTHSGEDITVALDGAELLQAEDEAIPGPGGIGLWTKADARTSFDDLVLKPGG